MSAHDLPPEILLQIFRYLDIPDITQTRRASRYLNEVTRFRGVWDYAYHKADFTRPPGPYPSQSTADLENALISSFRMHRNFQRGGAAHKLGEIQYTGKPLHVGLVFGRFLLMMFKEKVLCHDLNIDGSNGIVGSSVIYRPTDGTLIWCRCESAFDVYGRPYACMVLKQEVQGESQIQVSTYLLSMSKQSNLALDLLLKFAHPELDIQSVHLGPRVILIHGTVGPSDDDYVVALDLHTHLHLRLPPLGDVLRVGEGDWLDDGITCLSTSTHILLARPTYVDDGCDTFFVAFALPTPDSYMRSVTLGCSHHGTVRMTKAQNLRQLSDTVFDASSQDILVLIQVDMLISSDFKSTPKYGLLRLGRSDREKTNTNAFQPIKTTTPFSQVGFDRPCFRGTGRTYDSFVRWKFDRPITPAIIVVSEYDMGTDDDDTDDAYVETVRTYPSFECSLTPHYMRLPVIYEPYGSRICLQYTDTVEILDFAV